MVRGGAVWCCDTVRQDKVDWSLLLLFTPMWVCVLLAGSLRCITPPHPQVSIFVVDRVCLVVLVLLVAVVLPLGHRRNRVFGHRTGQDRTGSTGAGVEEHFGKTTKQNCCQYFLYTHFVL